MSSSRMTSSSKNGPQKGVRLESGSGSENGQLKNSKQSPLKEVGKENSTGSTEAKNGAILHQKSRILQENATPPGGNTPRVVIELSEVMLSPEGLLEGSETSSQDSSSSGSSTERANSYASYGEHFEGLPMVDGSGNQGLVEDGKA